MAMPRQNLPAQVYLITRRTTQRQFLLRPDDETKNIFIYCLAEAAKRYRIDVMLTVMMSNHHHTVIYDRYGNVSEFIEHFHKMVAKCMNALRGRSENFWASEETSIVRLVDTEDVFAKLVYTATNPVKDHLVEHVSDWPGVNGLEALLEGRPLTASRPKHFFREDGPMPEHIELRLFIPDEVGDAAMLLPRLRDAVERFEQRAALTRELMGIQVLGRRRILRQSWHASPTSLEPRRGLRPRVAARSVWSRIAALQRNRQFIDDYRRARAAWLSGDPIPFPVGTYWLRRFMKVPIASAPDVPQNLN
jgi:REP element-mobilizing transposase RayT